MFLISFGGCLAKWVLWIGDLGVYEFVAVGLLDFVGGLSGFLFLVLTRNAWWLPLWVFVSGGFRCWFYWFVFVRFDGFWVWVFVFGFDLYFLLGGFGWFVGLLGLCG